MPNWNSQNTHKTQDASWWVVGENISVASFKILYTWTIYFKIIEKMC